jgi:hypothetical protein
VPVKKKAWLLIGKSANIGAIVGVAEMMEARKSASWPTHFKAGFGASTAVDRVR